MEAEDPTDCQYCKHELSFLGYLPTKYPLLTFNSLVAVSASCGIRKTTPRLSFPGQGLHQRGRKAKSTQGICHAVDWVNVNILMGKPRETHVEGFMGRPSGIRIRVG